MSDITAPTDDRELEQDILFGVINRFIGYFTRQAVPATTNDTAREYPFVAMDTRQAYRQLRLAARLLSPAAATGDGFRLIDIGCGIGNILLLGEAMGFSVFGIEKDRASLAIVRELLEPQCIGETDIWSFDGLADFDVIYYFRPFCEKGLQQEFERLIEDGIKPGAVLIANRKMDSSIDEDPRFHRPDPRWPVWRRQTG